MSCIFLKKWKKEPLEPGLLEIKEELKHAIKMKKKEIKHVKISIEESNLVNEIKRKTTECNVNNVTRTKAYLDYYQLHPEIRWAFLAHMVSRNAGWNMTDLRGELLEGILLEPTKYSCFKFLERGNWLIFEDVFPQLLLYQESKRRNVNLFRLLPLFNVSAFMKTIWDHYWKYRNQYILNISLIINEQNFIESRVIQNTDYKKEVFETLEFKLQDLLSFNHILFPYQEGKETGKPNLLGQTVHHFHQLHERIMVGKRLYALVFNERTVLEKMLNWAVKHPHTGSRKDYYTHIFNDIRDSVPGTISVPRLNNCQLRKGASRIYSPRLEVVWNNVRHPEAERGDWFSECGVVHYLTKFDEKIDGEIVNEYCETLTKIELAATAKQAFTVLD